MTSSVVLSEEPGAGVAPRSGSLRLLVEGWRFMPHSYSIVNQQQCLELLRRPAVTLMHRDTKVLPQLGDEVLGILAPEDEERIRAIPPPGPGDAIDAVYRIGYPYDFGPSLCDTTFVFATCERMMLTAVDVLSPPTTGGRTARHFSSRIRDNGIVVVTPSEWSKRGFIRSGVDADRIRVVPHGIDPAVFRPLPPEEKAVRRAERNQDGFTFLHVSAMTGNKNIGLLIRAFLTVARRHPTARLLLKGLDRTFFSNKWVSQELGRLSDAERAVAKTTIFYNGLPLRLADQVLLYQLADAYVAPYQSEGFNMPVLEAAACGVPIVTTGGGPTDEFTTPEFCLPIKAAYGDHHHDGSMWLDVDEKSLVEQMERAIMDRDWTVRAAVAGPEHVHERYSWRSVVDRLLDVVSLKGAG